MNNVSIQTKTTTTKVKSEDRFTTISKLTSTLFNESQKYLKSNLSYSVWQN